MFHLISGIILVYVACRLLLPLSIGLWAKLAFFAVLLLIAEKHFIMRNFFGTMASPEVPSLVLMAVGWIFTAFILLALLLFAKDIILIIFWLLRKAGVPAALPFSPGIWAAGLCSLSLLLSAYGVWQAVRVPDVYTVEVTLPRLPAELDGFSIVQLTDLHASKLLQAPRTRAIVDKTNGLNPDLILLTGDMIDGTPANRADDVAPLRDLRAAYGVFGCMGNHEYYSDYTAWQKAFKELGLPILLNEHVLLNVNGHDLVLAGTTDRVADRFNFQEPDVEAALKGAPENAPRILMAHQPSGALKNAEAGVDLQLSGHTHGGQISLMRPLVASFNDGYVSGLYDVDGMRLYVSNGAGLWNGFPVRLGVPAEITRIVLRSGTKE